MSLKKTHPKGVHPEVLPRLFPIHLRTFFRLFRRRKIRLAWKQSKLAERDHVLELLISWYSSFSLDEARERLGVTLGTISAWRSPKWRFLQGVKVLGFVRVTRASVEALLAQPNYELGAKKPLVNAGAPENLRTMLKVKTKELEGKMETEARAKAEEKLEAELEKFSLAEAKLLARKAEALARSKARQKIRRRIFARNKYRSLVREQRNVEREALAEQAKAEKVVRQTERQFKPKPSLSAPAKKPSVPVVEQKVSAPLVSYVGTNKAEREAIGTKNVVTLENAAGYLGLRLWEVQDLATKSIRVFGVVGEKTLLYRSSVEAQKSIRENGSLRLRDGKK